MTPEYLENLPMLDETEEMEWMGGRMESSEYGIPTK
jgi:hypothetical protein